MTTSETFVTQRMKSLCSIPVFSGFDAVSAFPVKVKQQLYIYIQIYVNIYIHNPGGRDNNSLGHQ